MVLTQSLPTITTVRSVTIAPLTQALTAAALSPMIHAVETRWHEIGVCETSNADTTQPSKLWTDDRAEESAWTLLQTVYPAFSLSESIWEQVMVSPLGPSEAIPRVKSASTDVACTNTSYTASSRK